MGTPAAARWAITGVFGGNGLLIASLAVRTPSLKLDLGLSPGQLGLLSALFGIAAVLTMQRTGSLAARFGSATIVRTAAVVLPIGLVGLGWAPEWAALVLVQIVLGVGQGLLDVTMNAHAVAVERALERHIINGCHAAWSIGAVAGSLIGSVAAAAGISRLTHYTVLAVLLLPAALIGCGALLPAGADRSEAAAARIGWRTGWSKRILLFGAMGATILTTEAAVAMWSGVYLHEYRNASLGAAALGYVAFAGCQTAGRLVGDRLRARKSAGRLLRVGTLTAASGLALVVLSPWAAGSIAGFAVLGLGLATPLPVLFGVVGHLGAGREGAAAMVSRFSTMTFTGILLAPAVIGGVTELIGLDWTLTALIPLLGLVAVAASRAPQAGATMRQAAMIEATRPERTRPEATRTEATTTGSGQRAMA